ncbi:hypothetical protein A2U01_0049779, partial [Trifolium medium]|nr:hypothetical protein [Trifolium medium]
MYGEEFLKLRQG